MSYELNSRLVVGVASSALFDLRSSDSVFRADGEEAYRNYQEENLTVPLNPGAAFPFVKRLLSLNDLSSPEDPLTEVIVLSKNDPDTGLRAMRSVAHHQLPITRAIFMQGRSPYKFMSALNMSLFLSADEADVRQAVALNLPAGQVLESSVVDDDDDELRIAFDFDGVLADDESEQVMQAGGIEKFHQHEVANMVTPHDLGPLRDFLASINKIQKREEQRRRKDPSYNIRLRVSLVTARNAPSHERAVQSLKSWGVTVNEAFFLGGIDKARILHVLKPHIFFDDQESHLAAASLEAPSVHVPFGLINQKPTEITNEISLAPVAGQALAS